MNDLEKALKPNDPILFEKAIDQAKSWIMEYLQSMENIKVHPDCGYSLSNSESVPVDGIGMEEMMADFEQFITPGVNYWTHSGFMGYFNSSTTPAGMAAEMLITAINANCMTRLACPVGTDLEISTCKWLQQLLGLSEDFFGIMYEGGSSSNFHALVAARNKYFGGEFKNSGYHSVQKKYCVYFSDQTHSSIQKSLSVLGFGYSQHRLIRSSNIFRIDVGALESAIEKDKENGNTPMCVVASIGTTSSTATDDIKSIAAICKRENMWLHIDASHGGALALLPEKSSLFEGWEEADSITINPHKWMFVPLDMSVLFIKQPYLLKEAFSLETEYLKNPQEDDSLDFMDYSISLGRRFRSLKLWFTIKYLGLSGLQKALRNHLKWAQWLTGQIDNFPLLEVNAPVEMSTICFSIKPTGAQSTELKNELTKKLLLAINDTGKFFLTHTKLSEVFVIRVVISSYMVSFEKIQELWGTIRHETENILRIL